MNSRGGQLPGCDHEPTRAPGFTQDGCALLIANKSEIERLRYHDSLTGLPNRRRLRERLDAWSRESAPSYLLAIEIDRFNSVNDALGEAKGDAVLLRIGERLAAIAGESGAMAARIGGDEFAVFSDRLTLADAEALAATLRTALSAPFEIAGSSISVTASIGIAVVDRDATRPETDQEQEQEPEDLLVRADLALQAAKQGGGNRAHTFHPRLREGAARRMQLEQELRAALNGDVARAGSFTLFYQPCVSLASQSAPATREPSGKRTPPLRGFEALLRWHHPKLGDVGPGEFIAIAEECGLIAAIGDFVLRNTIDQLAGWRDAAAGLPVHAWRIAVNVSPRQLGQTGFAQHVLTLLAQRDLQPCCLTIEVTEGVFADEAATAVVAELRRAGIRIAVDDFGIGYSSLSYLRRLPADELKFDRSFLQTSDGSPRHEEFLAALVQLARAAGLSVLAEGVETEAHLAAVAAAGCDAAQGWLFARAMPAAEAAEWIAAATAETLPDRDHAPLPFSFRSIVEEATEAVMVTNATLEEPGPAIVYVNPAFARMCGWTLGEMLGRSPRFLQGPRTDLKAIADLMRDVRAGRPAGTRVVNYTSSGMPYWVEMRLSPLHDQNGHVTHYLSVQRDVTHDIRRFDELERLALRDPLTSIANRRGLSRFAEHVPMQDGNPLCIAYFDIDHFKAINDGHGHPTGDAVLLGIADVLAENMRRVDFVGRLGGDEFVVCMPAIRPTDALAVAQRLHRTIAGTEFATPSGPIRIGCSVGVATTRPGDNGIEDAIARADAALYAAKAAGRGRVILDSGVQTPLKVSDDRVIGGVPIEAL